MTMNRQWTCRILFITLAVIPTLLMSLWASWAHARRVHVEKRAAWEHRVLQEMGLMGRAAQIKGGERNDVILDDVTLVDPETDALVASIRRLHVAPAGERGWVIEASYPQIAGDQLLRLWTPIYDRLRHTRGNLDWSGLVTANHTTLNLVTGSQTLSHLECQFGSSRSGSFAKLDFLVAGLNMTRRAQLVISRDRALEKPETFVLLNTGPQPLPCSLAYSALPSLARFGPDCHFQGQFKVRLNDEGWRGEEMNGRLGPVDFTTLITDLFPHHLLSGKAVMEIRQAQFEDGRLIAAEGEIHSENGSISRSLLEGAVQHLGWHVADAVSEKSNSRFRYVQLHFGFRLDAEGLVVEGKCGEPGVILLGEQGPLAWESGAATPITNCVKLLVPDSTHQVPATRQTAWLAGVLPVPNIAPLRTAIRPDNPPLRLQQKR